MRQMRLPRLGFQNLLCWLFLYLMVSPFLTSLPYAKFILKASLTAVFLFAIYAVRNSKKFLSITITLLVLTVMLHWIGHLLPAAFITPLTAIITAMYLAVLIYAFFEEIFGARRVTWNLIAATLCVYLFIGVLWGTIFSLLESVSPGSFSGELLHGTVAAGERIHVFIYFSFITLTTLGYGDITPLTQGATALCQAEAIIGQFFMAVMVARLVGMQISQKPGNEEEYG
jgi:voltage-gated potassium channel